MIEDVARAEVAERDLDRFIERRSRGVDPDENMKLWRESVRRYHERHRRERAAAWHAFHLDQAERIERTAAALASAHRGKAEALLEELGGA